MTVRHKIHEPIANITTIAENVKKIDDRVEDATLMFSQAQIETMEKQNQAEQMITMGMAEIYEEVSKLKEQIQKITGK